MNTIGDTEQPFWVCMAKDTQGIFKAFLLSHKYDGIEYYEEFSSNFDPSNPSQYTRAVTVFNANDIKLADGRNLTFNPMVSDVRMKEGGNVETPKEQSILYSKKDLLDIQIFGKPLQETGKESIEILNFDVSENKATALDNINFVENLIKKMNNGI
jgi:hypothetical protein